MKKMKFLPALAATATALSLSACSLLPMPGAPRSSDTTHNDSATTQSSDATMSAATTTETPSTSDEWPEAFHTQFMSSCTATAGVTEEYCQCTYDAAHEKYTMEEFTKISLDAMSGDKEAGEAIGALAGQCLDKL